MQVITVELMLAHQVDQGFEVPAAGAEAVEAHEALGFGADMRDYSICKSMLDHLHIKTVKLMR